MATAREKKLQPRAWGLALALTAAFAFAPALHAAERTLDVGNGKTLRYELLDQDAPSSSARATALVVLRHLADGNIAEAARLSNAPARREEVLREYQSSVGGEEFKRVFLQYLDNSNAVVAEVAIGAHRLIIWRLAGPGKPLAGQFYVERDGRFLLDDVPSETRSNLRRVLQSYRAGATASERKD